MKALVIPTAVYAASEDWGTGGDSTTTLADRIDRAGAELAELLTRREPAAPTDPFENVTPVEQQLSR